jgi:hypothetical protein
MSAEDDLLTAQNMLQRIKDRTSHMARLRPGDLTLQEVARDIAIQTDPALREANVSYPEVVALRSALAEIARLPERFGYFNGPDAATEAVRIAKEALARAE